MLLRTVHSTLVVKSPSPPSNSKLLSGENIGYALLFIAELSYC